MVDSCFLCMVRVVRIQLLFTDRLFLAGVLVRDLPVIFLGVSE